KNKNPIRFANGIFVFFNVVIVNNLYRAVCEDLLCLFAIARFSFVEMTRWRIFNNLKSTI
ncbi:hypothetical protein, partial [Flavobacterium johnsoniae]|uniref:hypothetical protein n=1 Tax=Flavobacterium johnsoniae TaxID=986 RepID=UPI001A9C479E